MTYTLKSGLCNKLCNAKVLLKVTLKRQTPTISDEGALLLMGPCVFEPLQRIPDCVAFTTPLRIAILILSKEIIGRLR